VTRGGCINHQLHHTRTHAPHNYAPRNHGHGHGTGHRHRHKQMIQTQAKDAFTDKNTDTHTHLEKGHDRYDGRGCNHELELVDMCHLRRLHILWQHLRDVRAKLLKRATVVNRCWHACVGGGRGGPPSVSDGWSGGVEWRGHILFPLSFWISWL
jgi:hypothetical protein